MGKITLIKAVVEPIYIYSMSNHWRPNEICEDLDKGKRNNRSMESNAIHTVIWHILYLSKRDGIWGPWKLGK